MNLLIDIGSTNIKFAFAERNIINTGSFKFPQPVVDDGSLFEVRTSDILEIIKRIIDLSSDVKNIFISTQMHGYVLLDENKNELTNYISWRDKRSTLVGAKIAVDSSFGVGMKPNLPRASIEYFKANNPSLYSRIAYFTTLGSYVCYKLTGINASHITDLCPTGFYSAVNKCVENTSFSIPKACYEVSCVGSYKGINVYSPVGDQQASIYGIESEDTLVLNLGTASQICEISDKFISGNFESRPFFHNKFLLTKTNMPGSDMIKAGIDKETLLDIYRRAMSDLPKNKKLLLTGGLLFVLKDYFVDLFKNSSLDISFNDGMDALNGLLKISKEVL